MIHMPVTAHWMAPTWYSKRHLKSNFSAEDASLLIVAMPACKHACEKSTLLHDLGSPGRSKALSWHFICHILCRNPFRQLCFHKRSQATWLSLKYSLLNPVSKCLWSPPNKVSKRVHCQQQPKEEVPEKILACNKCESSSQVGSPASWTSYLYLACAASSNAAYLSPFF